MIPVARVILFVGFPFWIVPLRNIRDHENPVQKGTPWLRYYNIVFYRKAAHTPDLEKKVTTDGSGQRCNGEPNRNCGETWETVTLVI